MFQHGPAEAHDPLDGLRRHRAAREVDRGLDHRQREAFDAVAVEPEVAPLHLDQARHHVVGLAVVLQQIEELLLGQMEDRLVVPERIVRIEADGGDGLGHGARY
jgi:hypothetical protein